MKIKQTIESLLFVGARPVTLKKLSQIIKTEEKEIKTILDELIKEYDAKQGGMVIVRDGQKYQMMTAPETAKFITEYLHEDLTGELTRPSLEALTIVAYRQPVAKQEIEMIRGINCSLILRNLLIRGLIEAEEDQQTKITRYRLTFDFLQRLGLKDARELPDFGKLNADISLDELLNQNSNQEQNNQEK